MYAALLVCLLPEPDWQAELVRFPPNEILLEWAWQCRCCEDACTVNMVAFPGRGWDMAMAKARLRAYGLDCICYARRYGPKHYREYLHNAHDALGDRWYYSPWLIGVELFDFLPTYP